jgi:small-conductance mechanosensitive channel
MAETADAVSEFVTQHRAQVNAVLAVAAVFLVYGVMTRALRAYLKKRDAKQQNVQNFFVMWRYAWLGVGVLMLIVAFAGSFAAMGISAAFLGMILGWSLQAPVTGIAAWLMIIAKRPFRIGDRVIISGIIGDVVDITLTHVVLNQVGGTIGGEEPSGRGVLIPNATLFQQIIYNYAFETKYILDEVPVLITYESDVEAAERICVAAAEQVTADVVADSGTAPFIRRELADSGIRLRLRYNTLATSRQQVSSEIVRLIIGGFGENPDVEFCYPHTEILYRPKNGRTAE